MFRFPLIMTAGPLLMALTLAAFGLGMNTASAENIDGCGRTGPRIESGQTGIGLGEHALRVPLPAEGTFFSLPATPTEVPGPALFVCHVESGSSIVIDAFTANEVTRTVGDPSGAAVLDAIAEAAYVEEIAIPTPMPSGPLTPPTTGDGGLKPSQLLGFQVSVRQSGDTAVLFMHRRSSTIECRYGPARQMRRKEARGHEVHAAAV